MMRKSVRKHCFTLLEMLVVLFIISLGIIVTGVKIKGMYQEQRFLSETQQVLSHLSMAQDLMLIMDTEVLVHFSQKKDGDPLHLWLEIEKPLEPKWARLVERKLSLTAIYSMKFNGRSAHEFDLLFSLGKMSEGKLVLFEKKQEKDKKENQFEILLLGYPSPLGDKKTAVKQKTKVQRSELLYPVEVYEKLYKDPNEKNAKT